MSPTSYRTAPPRVEVEMPWYVTTAGLPTLDAPAIVLWSQMHRFGASGSSERRTGGLEEGDDLGVGGLVEAVVELADRPEGGGRQHGDHGIGRRPEDVGDVGWSDRHGEHDASGLLAPH